MGTKGLLKNVLGCRFRISKAATVCYSDALRDLVIFLQFKKREKHPWKIVIFRKVAD